MNKSSGFSKRFLEATPEERLEYFKKAVVTDRSELPPEIREELEKADKEMSERWKGKLPEPKVVDMRPQKHAG